jgi:hypothetical protein
VRTTTLRATRRICWVRLLLLLEIETNESHRIHSDRRLTFSLELNLEGNYRPPPPSHCTPAKSTHLSKATTDPNEEDEHSLVHCSMMDRNLYLRGDFEENGKDTDWREMIFHCFIIHLDLSTKNIQRIEKNMFREQRNDSPGHLQTRSGVTRGLFRVLLKKRISHSIDEEMRCLLELTGRPTTSG